MSPRARWSFFGVVALTMAAPLSASAQWQAPAEASPAWSVPTSVTEPAAVLDFMSWSEWSTIDAPAEAAPVFPGVTRQSEDVALMIVGGAALVVGSVIGGDAGTLMMVGGGVMGLVGLYRYIS